MDVTRVGLGVSGHLHGVTRRVAGPDTEGSEQVPLLHHRVPRKEVIASVDEVRVHPGVTPHAVPDPHGRAARPGQPGAARTPMQIDCDIESFSAKMSRVHQIVAPSRQARSPGDHQHGVQMGIAANDRFGQRLDDVGEVRIRIRPPQRVHERCREHDVADQSEPDKEDLQGSIVASSISITGMSSLMGYTL